MISLTSVRKYFCDSRTTIYLVPSRKKEPRIFVFDPRIRSFDVIRGKGQRSGFSAGACCRDFAHIWSRRPVDTVYAFDANTRIGITYRGLDVHLNGATGFDSANGGQISRLPFQ